ncbi:MAG: nucleoside-diphosphate kinase [Candidatus Aenigmatarchaeota archaeon]
MIKPEGMPYKGHVVRKLLETGAKIIAYKVLPEIPEQTARELYAVHEGTDFYPRLVKQLSSEPGMAILLESRNPRIISVVRKALGNASPDMAESNSIRRIGWDGAESIELARSKNRAVRNIAHAADMRKHATREAYLFFNDRPELFWDMPLHSGCLELLDDENALSWSLAKEGEGVFMEERITEKLRGVGLIGRKGSFVHYKDIELWKPFGEMYVAAGQVVTERKSMRCERKFVAKVCTNLNPAKRMVELLDRRTILSQQGVNVPYVYGCDSGTIYEEYIEHDLIEYLKHNLLQREKVIPALRKTARILDANGFRPLDFLRDCRTDGEYVYYIDFGFDLGEPSNESTDIAEKQLKKFLLSL